ncbi:MAG TPA: hemerythrin domain-containing protein [Solimonas sp.]|nr:hemerythrin domain-containing protein [Solimonas sp.]
MDIYEVLRRDHRRIESLLRDLESANHDEAALRERTSLFHQVKALVVAHSEAEEEVFYTRLRKDESTGDAAREGAVEHGLVGALLETLAEMRPSSKDWAPHCKVVRELLEHHIEEEEREMFPAAQEVIDEDEAERLGERMEEKCDELLEEQQAEVA